MYRHPTFETNVANVPVMQVSNLGLQALYCTNRRDHFVTIQYLFKPVEGVVELPLAVEGKQPHLLPP
jgi:hypothetical protein